MPTREESWAQFATELGGEFVRSEFRLGPFRLKGSAEVVAKINQWTTRLDTYSVGGGEGGSQTYTRMRAPYIAKHPGFRFEIYREGLFSKLGKAIGMQDIGVGYPDLDRAFIIKGSDESMVRALFANEKIRQCIHGLPPAHLRVRKLGELCVEEAGVITDVARLKSLYDLLSETLNQLVEIGAASEEGAGIDS